MNVADAMKAAERLKDLGLKVSVGGSGEWKKRLD